MLNFGGVNIFLFVRFCQSTVRQSSIDVDLGDVYLALMKRFVGFVVVLVSKRRLVKPQRGNHIFQFRNVFIIIIKINHHQSSSTTSFISIILDYHQYHYYYHHHHHHHHHQINLDHPFSKVRHIQQLFGFYVFLCWIMFCFSMYNMCNYVSIQLARCGKQLSLYLYHLPFKMLTLGCPRYIDFLIYRIHIWYICLHLP